MVNRKHIIEKLRSESLFLPREAYIEQRDPKTGERRILEPGRGYIYPAGYVLDSTEDPTGSRSLGKIIGTQDALVVINTSWDPSRLYSSGDVKDNSEIRYQSVDAFEYVLSQLRVPVQRKDFAEEESVKEFADSIAA